MENTQATGFRAEIKLRISDIHRETQNLPYIKALLQNDLPKIAYVGYLKGMAIVYGALEQQLLGQDGLILKPYLNNYLRKLPLLLADLESLDGCHTPDILPASVRPWAWQIPFLYTVSVGPTPYWVISMHWTVPSTEEAS